MARSRLREGITTALRTILGNLARFFRLGTAGAVPNQAEAQAGRQRIRTPEEIIALLYARHELPTASQGTRRSYSYVAEWTDTETGERLGATRIQIESDTTTPQSTIYSRARAEARLQLPRYVAADIISDRRIKIRLRKISTVDLPPTP